METPIKKIIKKLTGLLPWPSPYVVEMTYGTPEFRIGGVPISQVGKNKNGNDPKKR